MNSGAILGLDIGSKQIGVALASRTAKLASPLTTIENSPKVVEEIRKIVSDNDVDTLVIGVPRGLGGQSTKQTTETTEFIDKIRSSIGLNIVEQDEAVTSIRAEEELKSRGRPYSKSDIDALSATYILEDYLREIV